MRFLKHAPLRFWIILASCVIIVALSCGKFFNNYELLSYDLRFKLRPPLQISQDIVIIEISDDTLKNLNSWPLPRDFHASLLDALREFGAKMVVFDVLFSEPTLYDDIFANAIERAGNVYFPLAFHISDDYRRDLPEADIILAGISENLEQYAAGTGHINVSVDKDGKVRKVPLFVKYNDKVFPHLGLKAASDWLGVDVRGLALPILPDGTFLVNYPDKWNRSFRRLSYFSILKSYRDAKQGIAPEIDPSIIKDKICFIGLTAAGTSDLRPMPLENIYPMLGLQASVFNSIINQDFITRASVALNILVSIFIFILTFLICMKFSAIKAFAGNALLGIIYFSISAILFIFYGIWVDLFLPILVIALTYIGATLYRFLDETRKRQLLEKELNIAREIQKSFLPGDIKEFNGLEISSFLQPAKFVAGDLYDIFPIDDRKIGVLIGDVSGKGVPASLIMAQTISLFRLFSRQYSNCSEVLERLNKELCGKFSGRFVTALYMIIDTVEQKAWVSSAGHSPVLVHKNGSTAVSEIELSADMPLGIMEDVEYKDVTFYIKAGDKIILFTDGVNEARNKGGQEYGLEDVKNVISGETRDSSEALSRAIRDGLSAFSSGVSQHDDITLIVLGLTRV